MFDFNEETKKAASEEKKFEGLPAGKYHVSVESYEERTTQAGKGYARVTYKVVSGDKAGLKIWISYFQNQYSQDNLNAVALATGKIDACVAMGSFEGAIGGELILGIKYKESKGGGDPFCNQSSAEPVRELSGDAMPPAGSPEAESLAPF